MAECSQRGWDRRGWRAWLAGALVLGGSLLAGCSLPEAKPDLTRYYVLTPMAAVDAGAKPAEQAPRVFVRSVTAPDFLRGRIMQVRVSENELRFVDTARWAEPLEAGFQRVLRENLERAARVHVVGRATAPHEFEVAVQLRRCEGVMPAGAARLAARIEVFSAELDPKLLAHEEFTAEIPGWDGQNHDQLARKLSEAAVQLADRVAELVPAGS